MASVKLQWNEYDRRVSLYSGQRLLASMDEREFASLLQQIRVFIERAKPVQYARAKAKGERRMRLKIMRAVILMQIRASVVEFFTQAKKKLESYVEAISKNRSR